MRVAPSGEFATSGRCFATYCYPGGIISVPLHIWGFNSGGPERSPPSYTPPGTPATCPVTDEKGARVMLDAAAKSAIKESTTAQLTEMYYRLVGVNSLRSAQGVGKDQVLAEMVAEVVAEMNARKVGDRAA